MRFCPPLVCGTLLRRYKRFLADVRLGGGRTVVAHCPNPGSMKSVLAPGERVWLSEQHGARRKLRYTWEVAEVDETFVYVNPARANELVLEAVKTGAVRELLPYAVIEREVRVGSSSRIDFRLRGEGRADCYVEVKNVTLGYGGGRSAFPDSVTARGVRHLRELVELRRAGARAVLFFCASRADATSVEPADAIDPLYGQVLREAARAGVEVIAYRVAVSPAAVRLAGRVPVLLTG